LSVRGVFHWRRPAVDAVEMTGIDGGD